MSSVAMALVYSKERKISNRDRYNTLLRHLGSPILTKIAEGREDWVPASSLADKDYLTEDSLLLFNWLGRRSSDTISFLPLVDEKEYIRIFFAEFLQVDAFSNKIGIEIRNPSRDNVLATCLGFSNSIHTVLRCLSEEGFKKWYTGNTYEDFCKNLLLSVLFCGGSLSKETATTALFLLLRRGPTTAALLNATSMNSYEQRSTTHFLYKTYGIQFAKYFTSSTKNDFITGFDNGKNFLYSIVNGSTIDNDVKKRTKAFIYRATKAWSELVIRVVGE